MDKKYDQYEKSELEKLENRLKNLDAALIKNKESGNAESPEATTATTTTSKLADKNETDDEKTNKIVEQLLKEIKVDQDLDEKVRKMFHRFNIDVINFFLLILRIRGVACAMQMLN